MLRVQRASSHGYERSILAPGCWQDLLRCDALPLPQRHHRKEETVLEKQDFSVGKLATLLHQCGTSKDLQQAHLLYSHLIKHSLETLPALQNALLRSYSLCSALDEACLLFARSPQAQVPSWAHIITAHARLARHGAALQHFHQMCLEGTMPTKPTYVSALSSAETIDDVKFMHTRIRSSGKHLDVVIATALVNVYMSCHCPNNAKRAFDDSVERDMVLWTIIITTYVQKGQGEVALKLFQQMIMEGALPNEFTYASALSACDGALQLENGKIIHSLVACSEFHGDIVVHNALFTMYGKCGTWEDAMAVFDESTERDKVTWNAIIGACAQHGHGKDALSYVQKMQQHGFFPDKLTFVSAFGACTNQLAMNEGKKLHTHFVSAGLETCASIENALLNMYGRCGIVARAHLVFDGMRCRDVITWSAIIAAYAQHGLAENALDLTSKMVEEGVIPNSITFVNMLSACGQAGLVKEGCDCFAKMGHFGVTPIMEHYNCLIDLLSRAGRLDEGEMLLKQLPGESSLALWTSFLGGCRMHFDMERGQYAASQAFLCDIQEAGPYIILRNMLEAESCMDVCPSPSM